MAEKSFEVSYDELMEQVSKMKSGKLSLDDSIKCYKDGIEAYNNCIETLDKARQEIVFVEGAADAMKGESEDEAF